MRRSLRVGLSVAAGLVLLVAPASPAQQTDPHRWAMHVGADVGNILNFYGESCKTPAPAAGGGISLLRRLPHRLVAIVDTRANGVLDVFGCKTTVPPPRPIGPNEYEHNPVNVYPNGAPRKPQYSQTPLPSRSDSRLVVHGWTQLHLGLELPLR